LIAQTYIADIQFIPRDLLVVGSCGLSLTFSCKSK